MQARGRLYTTMVLKASSSLEETLTLHQNSVLKKSQTRSFMTKFSKNVQVYFSDAVMVSMAKCPVTQSPQRNSENPIMRAKISEKNENQGVLKLNEKNAEHKHLKVGFQGRKNQTHLLQGYKYMFCPNQSHCALARLGESISKVRKRNCERLREWELDFEGAAHTPRSAVHTEGMVHTQPARSGKFTRV